MKCIRVYCLAVLMGSGMLLMGVPTASAIPAFSRRYSMSCAVCHSAWPALNEVGEDFRMSGYRRFGGTALTPTTPDVELVKDAVSIPAVPPVGFQAVAGFDFQHVRRRAEDGTTATRKGASFDLNALELLVGTPMGKHLAFFLDYDLFETEIERPTGPGEANETDSRRNITFETEGPRVPALAKLIWNSLLPSHVAPLDSLNVIVGINELPVAFSPEHRRLSASPYLVYMRRGLDLVGRTPLEDLLTEGEGRRLFQLSKAQIGVEFNGVLRPESLGIPLRVEYHLGVTNGSNTDTDPNTEKDVFGRVSARAWGQTLGVFGYWSADIYDNALREAHAIPEGGPFSGRRHNAAYSVGPDLTLSLQPWAVPLWLETQVLFNHESNPTGFDQGLNWWGGFSQLNWKPVESLIAYSRYDWIRGERFDDTAAGGVTSAVRPREWAAVVGLQWYALANLRLITEYSHHAFRNTASIPATQKVHDDFFTLRAALAF